MKKKKKKKIELNDIYSKIVKSIRFMMERKKKIYINDNNN